MYCTLIWEPQRVAGGMGAPVRRFGGNRPRKKNKKNWQFLHPFLALFRHMVFADCFLIPVKELDMLTNPGQWIMGLDATGSFIYIYIYIYIYICVYCIINNEDIINRILEVWLYTSCWFSTEKISM
jgi:hypothetical protein